MHLIQYSLLRLHDTSLDLLKLSNYIKTRHDLGASNEEVVRSILEGDMTSLTLIFDKE